jgi:hypothetical protein
MRLIPRGSLRNALSAVRAHRTRTVAICVLLAIATFGCKRANRASVAVQGPTGAFVFGPSAVQRRDGKIDVFVVGSNRTVWRSPCIEMPCDRRSRYDDWMREGGAPPRGIDSRVGASFWNGGRWDIFAVGRDRRLWHQTRGGTRWMGWEDLGGELVTSPAVTSWSDGRLDVFVGKAGEEIQQRYCQATGPFACRGSSWYPWSPYPGRPPAGFIGDPAAVAPSTNQIDVAVLGRDGAIWITSYISGWGGWQSLGGQFVAPPALAALNGRTDIFALDAQGKLWRTTGANRTFEPFRRLAASLDEAPTAAGSQNLVELFARTKGGETLAHLSCDGDHCVSR